MGLMSSFEASGAALLARRRGLLVGELRERVVTGHRGQAVEAVVPVVEGLVHALSHYEAKGPEAADALACLESRCGLDAKTVDSAYEAFDKKEPWDEVLS